MIYLSDDVIPVIQLEQQEWFNLKRTKLWMELVCNNLATYVEDMAGEALLVFPMENIEETLKICETYLHSAGELGILLQSYITQIIACGKEQPTPC